MPARSHDCSGALAAYFRGEVQRRFELGSADCVTLVADWVRVVRGIDPIAPYRGYRGTENANALIAGSGGLPRLAVRAARRAGLSRTRVPEPGDVAIVAVGERMAVLAIHSRRGWVMRFDDGLALLPLDRVRVIAAWRL